VKHYTLSFDLFEELPQPKRRSPHMPDQCAECKSGKNYCSICKTHKTPDSFALQTQKKSRRKSYCYECQNIQNRVRTYNITEQEYLCILASQDNKCAICDVIFDAAKRGSGNRGKPNIDHDHATGKVRELLCSSCNHGLGCFRDNKNTLGKAMAYLTKHKSI